MSRVGSSGSFKKRGKAKSGGPPNPQGCQGSRFPGVRKGLSGGGRNLCLDGSGQIFDHRQQFVIVDGLLKESRGTFL